MQAMPVIHARARSDEAAVATVMAGPTLSADAATRFGNIEVASKNVSATAATDCAKNTRMSSFGSPFQNSAKPMLATYKMTHAQRATPNSGAISGAMRKCPHSDSKTYRMTAATCEANRKLRARWHSRESMGALQAIHDAPAAQNMARPSRPHSNVNGVIRPRSGMPL